MSPAVDVGPARGGARIKVVNPATGAVIREVAEDSAEAAGVPWTSGRLPAWKP